MVNVDVDCCGRTVQGRGRPVNEDQYLVARLEPERGALAEVDTSAAGVAAPGRGRGSARGAPDQLLVVADGMGGLACGGEASRIAVLTFADDVRARLQQRFSEETSEPEMRALMGAALERCHERIEAVRASCSPSASTMGTTLTAAIVRWPYAFVAHVGDSRCYLKRGRRLSRATRDHTIVQQLVDTGRVAPEKAGENRWAHVLWNALGGVAEVVPEVHRVDLRADDVLLLCSNGLTRVLSDAEIATLIDRARGAKRTCERLVEAALRAGADDDVTVVVARFPSRAGARPRGSARARTGTPLSSTP